MITRTIVILAYAAPDQNRKVYEVRRGRARSASSPTLSIDELVTTLTVPYAETVDYKSLAKLHATPEAPVWEKL